MMPSPTIIENNKNTKYNGRIESTSRTTREV
jgi:hypothetical protein